MASTDPSTPTPPPPPAPRRKGMSPATLRLLAWLCLVPIAGGLLSQGGLLKDQPVLSLLMASLYLAAFFGLRRLATRREQQDAAQARGPQAAPPPGPPSA